MITLDDLKKLNACKDGLEAFAYAFPNGAESWVDLVKHPDCMYGWKTWIIYRVLANLDRETGLGLIEQSDDPAYWRGYAAVYAPWVDRELGLELIEKSNNPAWWRGYAAVYAPWVDRELGLELIEKSNNPEFWLDEATKNARWMKETKD